jgi:hypothetical protein
MRFTLGITTKYIDRNPTAYMTNNPQMQIVAEICQNRFAGKDRFFRKSSVAQIGKCKTNES